MKDAYVMCAVCVYVKKKLPLFSHLLKCNSSLDPTARGYNLTLDRLQQLPSLVTNVLTNEELKAYAFENHQYQVDLNLPSIISIGID